MDVSILVVSFNTRELTLACLRSVRDETRDMACEVIVVDNASADESADAIATDFPEYTLMRLGENIGFARANNLAAESARGRYILLLNPDTLVLEDAIGRLVVFADAHPDALIYGGRTLFEDRSLNPTSCWNRITAWSECCNALGLSAMFGGSAWFAPEKIGGWQRDSAREVDVVTGCFLLIKRDLWRELDGFDPSYFMYGEDADLCLRARQHGARPLICPEATIVHLGGRSESHRASKLVRLLSARRTLIRRHLAPGARAMGAFWQSFGVWLRMVAYGASAMISNSKADAAATFREVWRRRREWQPGYAAMNAEPTPAQENS